MNQPWIVPVGGFLGAGKTALILAAARILASRGLRCAAILNDQGSDLVDTRQARAQGLAANDVADGCFCCRLSETLDRIEELRAANPDVVFVEPVGSCADLSATVLQPLKRELRGRYRIAPLTVCVDPLRVRELLETGGDQNFAFLFDHQLAEADLAVFTKCDLYPHADESLASSPTADGQRFVSAATGEGVADWLDEILSGKRISGAKLLEIDYDAYAEAEASLGWLNWRGTIRLPTPIAPAEIVGRFADSLDAALASAGVRIAHLKLFDQAGGAYVKAAITANGAEPWVEGDLTASPAWEHELVVNLRAAAHPEVLDALFRAELAKTPGIRTDERYRCFSPPRPMPERRMTEIVDQS